MKINIGNGFIFLTVFLCILKVIGMFPLHWIWCFSLIWMPFTILFGLIVAILAIAFPFLLVIVIHDLITR